MELKKKIKKLKTFVKDNALSIAAIGISAGALTLALKVDMDLNIPWSYRGNLIHNIKYLMGYDVI